MNVETVITFTAEAAAGGAIRAMYDEDPVMFGALTGFAAGVTVFLLPQDVAALILAVVLPFITSQVTHEVLKKELLSMLMGRGK